MKLIPQIAIVIGVFIFNRGEADESLWRIGRGTGVPLQGAIVVCAMVAGRRVTTNFGGVVVVPLQGAIVVCYGWGAEGDDQFWWSGRSATAGCHCSMLWLGRRVTTNFGGVVVVPLQGAIAGCHCSVLWLGGGG